MWYNSLVVDTNSHVCGRFSLCAAFIIEVKIVLVRQYPGTHCSLSSCLVSRLISYPVRCMLRALLYTKEIKWSYLAIWTSALQVWETAKNVSRLNPSFLPEVCFHLSKNSAAFSKKCSWVSSVVLIGFRQSSRLCQPIVGVRTFQILHRRPTKATNSAVSFQGNPSVSPYLKQVQYTGWQFCASSCRFIVSSVSSWSQNED